MCSSATDVELFACPLCRAPLNRRSGALVCPQQHSFDLAREGYVNLFPAHHRQSRSPGDDERMVSARRRFLDAGHYAPLLPELLAALTSVAGKPIANIVDLGCGEGYFTNALTGVAAHVYGIDVSKAAIRAAAKRYPALSLAVASSRRLPLVDAAFDAATAILAPIDPDVVRVLAGGGALLRVSPGPDHLRALRSLTYAEVRSHSRAITQFAGIEHASERLVRFTFDADRLARADLIAMTPMFYRTRDAQRARAMAPEHLTIECEFSVDVFRKSPIA
jgi:23S rRNA (guanine745-N1)-methyltransferase